MDKATSTSTLASKSTPTGSMTCGPLTILGNFDSGNFLNAELVSEPGPNPLLPQGVPGPSHEISLLGARQLLQGIQ
jgi:hypothetical protein